MAGMDQPQDLIMSLINQMMQGGQGNPLFAGGNPVMSQLAPIQPPPPEGVYGPGMNMQSIPAPYSPNNATVINNQFPQTGYNPQDLTGLYAHAQNAPQPAYQDQNPQLPTFNFANRSALIDQMAKDSPLELLATGTRNGDADSVAVANQVLKDQDLQNPEARVLSSLMNNVTRKGINDNNEAGRNSRAEKEYDLKRQKFEYQQTHDKILDELSKERIDTQKAGQIAAEAARYKITPLAHNLDGTVVYPTDEETDAELQKIKQRFGVSEGGTNQNQTKVDPKAMEQDFNSASAKVGGDPTKLRAMVNAAFSAKQISQEEYDFFMSRLGSNPNVTQGQGQAPTERK